MVQGPRSSDRSHLSWADIARSRKRRVHAVHAAPLVDESGIAMPNPPWVAKLISFHARNRRLANRIRTSSQGTRPLARSSRQSSTLSPSKPNL